jgi:hypothetical protein
MSGVVHGIRVTGGLRRVEKERILTVDEKI